MKLSPSQERAVEALRHDWPDTDAFVLWAPYGLGRSTMLQAVQKERGEIVLDMASYVERLTEAEPLALEETLHQMLIGALRENDVVLARAGKTSQICLTTHAEALATTIARLTGTPAVHLEKVDGETRVVEADTSAEDE